MGWSRIGLKEEDQSDEYYWFFRNYDGLECVGDGEKQKEIFFGGRTDMSSRMKLPGLLIYLFNELIYAN